MNRQRFMKELEELLRDIPDSERREAIQYYNDYFDDAGPERETQVIRELGTPAQVAANIRDEVSEGGEFTEHGYENPHYRNPQEVTADSGIRTEEKPSRIRKNFHPWKLLVILLLLPIILPAFLTLLSIVFAIFAGIFGLFIGVIAAAAVLPVAGIALIGSAVYNLFFRPEIGITLSGIGCILLSIGLLLILLIVWICKTIFPLLVKSIVSITRCLLRKAGIMK